LSALAPPPLALRISRIRSRKGASAPSRSSVEPSSQTTISRAATVWASSASSVSAIVGADW
jgi:hypothetical protein